uniref:Retrotransposon gag domain-containing protein n=1 Tax=Glossina palpalis gambiensis TaxID=67801 RepID=A0A1B0BPU7_9MUSC
MDLDPPRRRDNCLPHVRLLSTTPEVLKDKALTWYRHNRKQCTSCDAIKAGLLKFFCLPYYLERLDDEIRNLVQRANKTFKDYAMALQHLMRHNGRKGKIRMNFPERTPRLHGEWDFNLLGELLELVDDLETIPATNSSTSHREQHQTINTRNYTAANIHPSIQCPALTCNKYKLTITTVIEEEITKLTN